jgi:NADH-quinone oxidoreductase subunit L
MFQNTQKILRISFHLQPLKKKILFNLVGRPAAWFDRTVVDGIMNGLAWLTDSLSTLIKGLQSGKVQDYALFFFIGLFILAALAVHYFN